MLLFCYRFVCIAFIFSFCFPIVSVAEIIKPKQYGTEKRFRAWTYHPNGVYYFEGHHMYPTYIEFSQTETINTIYSPKPNAWQFVPVKNRLFIKPLIEDADTTLTVMTNERDYFFILHAKEPSGPFDPDIAFFVKFKYPYKTKEIGQGTGSEDSIIQFTQTKLPDLSKPELFNFNYTVSGDNEITPIKIFDDGKFTYLEFKDGHVIPAIFSVDITGLEAIVNFRILGPYLAIEGISSVFTLRHGPETVCVFNETRRGMTSILPKIDVNAK